MDESAPMDQEPSHVQVFDKYNQMPHSSERDAFFHGHRTGIAAAESDQAAVERGLRYVNIWRANPGGFCQTQQIGARQFQPQISLTASGRTISTEILGYKGT